MFTDPIYMRMLRKNCRSFCLLCATSFLLAMLAVTPVFGDTAVELDLVGQREPAPEESELIQKPDVADELNLAPSEAPSADCPPRTTTRVRPTPPVRVKPTITYSPQRGPGKDQTNCYSVYSTPNWRPDLHGSKGL